MSRLLNISIAIKHYANNVILNNHTNGKYLKVKIKLIQRGEGGVFKKKFANLVQMY